MFTHQTHERVRYAHTDQMGYVYYGNYAAFYEIGRVEAIRSLGLSYAKLEEDGFLMPVLDLHCKFLKAARYDDLLTIRTTVPEMPKARIRFTYLIENQAGEPLNEGETTLVFVKADTYRPTRLPETLREALAPYFS